MVLKFFGRGSGFSDNHNSAYFITEDNELVIIDCSVLTFLKLEQLKLESYRKIYVLITHTHGDHVGGLGLFVQYVYHMLRKHITIIAPSIEVGKDIECLLKIEGVSKFWYQLIPSSEIKKKWFGNSILTSHTPQLKGKCFGYKLFVNGTDVIYTGDTAILQPFVQYLTRNREFYVDISIKKTEAHLNLERNLEQLIHFTQSLGVKIYLMHCDNVELAEKVVKDIPNIEVVSIE